MSSAAGSGGEVSGGPALRAVADASQRGDQLLSVASLSSSGPALFCSCEDSNQGAQHLGRKPYYSGSFVSDSS